ncbi:MAG: efflux RND transporter periplasmic adaptor subunit [Planctomycetaceae bacterium]|nr:efflux RND transporter periplasmic adaptor subunit [Planctomycetaceae bacterium]
MSILSQPLRLTRHTVLFGFSVILLVLSTKVSSAQQSSDPPPSPVTAAPILYGKVQSTQTFVGTVVPTKTAIVGSAVDGRVIELRVDEGDRVSAQVFPKKKDSDQKDSEVPECCQGTSEQQDGTEESDEFDSGSIIAQVLTATIELEIEAAQKECVALHEEYMKLDKGNLPEEIRQAEALKEAAREVRDFLEKEYNRIKKLSDRGAVTERELQEAKYKWEQAKQVYNERKEASALAEEGPRVEDIAIAKARRDMQAKVVEKLQDQLKKYTIRSKFDGYIVKEFTEAGAWVNRGDPVAEVAALDEVDVLVNVLESAINFIERGEKVKVDIPSLAEESPRDGIVELIVPRADYKTRTFPVKIRLANEIHKGVPVLKAGMLAKVKLPTSPGLLAYIVPKDAITLGGSTPVIYVIEGATDKNQTGKPRPIAVETGIAVDNFMVVSPIDPKDKLKKKTLVVTQGNERMQGVAAVKVTGLNTEKPESGFKEQTKENASQVTRTDTRN